MGVASTCSYLFTFFLLFFAMCCDQVIGDLQEKLGVLQREQRLVEMALGQVRGQILDQERKRGKPFYEGTSLLQQDVTAFVRSVEKCIQELDMDLELRNDQINEVWLLVICT